MAKVTVQSYGSTENFVKSVLMGSGATEKDKNGRWYVDGTMINAELSSVIAEAIYIGEIFRDGQSVSGKYTADRKAGAVRVPLETPFAFTSRTLSYGGRKGTKGNGGLINVNPPIMPGDEEIMIYLNQVNDQSLYFADIAKEYLPLDMMAKKIAGYSKSVVQDRSGSTLAEILSYAIFRSLNGADNLNVFEKGTTKYGDLLADLNSKLDNGDILGGAYAFSTSGRAIIGRPDFINGMFASDSGVAVIGSTLAQEMLRDYDLSVGVSDRDYVGQNYKGEFAQFAFISCPDYIWTLAEKYLQVAPGSFKGIKAIAVSSEATAMGRVVDLGAKLVDATNGKRGIEVQPLNIWGHEAFRLSQIITDGSISNDTFTGLGFSDTIRIYPVAPSDLETNDQILVPIYDLNGAIIGYRPVVDVNKPNGGNFQSGLEKVSAPSFSVKGGSYSGAQSVVLTSDTEGATIYYTVNGSEPTTSSTKYSAAINVSASETVKAIAVKGGMVNSDVVAESYVIK